MLKTTRIVLSSIFATGAAGLFALSAQAMGRSPAYPTNYSQSGAASPGSLSDQFVEIRSTPEALHLNGIGIHVFYAENPVNYVLNDTLSTHIHSDAITLDEAGRVAGLIYNELSIYPVDCLQKSGFTKVLITSGLTRTYATDDIMRTIPVTAAPIFEQGTMVYDVGLIKGTYANADIYALTVINHEYLHYLDYQDKHLQKDNQWMAANNASPNGYGAGGDANRVTGYGDWDSSLSGYLDQYAESAMMEDKAEIFGGLATRPDQLAARTAADPILAQKTALLKTELESYCPSMASFWTNAQQTSANRLAFVRRMLPTVTSSDGQWRLDPATHQWVPLNNDPSAHNGFVWSTSSQSWVKP